MHRDADIPTEKAVTVVHMVRLAFLGLPEFTC